MPITDSLIPNLVEQWELETASGNRVGLKAGKILAESGGAVARVAGKTGAGPFAISLPASGTSFLSMAGDDATLDPMAGEFTVCFWAQILADGSGDVVLVKKGDAIHIDTQGGGGIFRCYTLGTGLIQVYANASDQQVRVGEWQFIAMRLNRTTGELTMTVRTPGQAQVNIHNSQDASGIGTINTGNAFQIGSASRTRGALIDNPWYFSRALTNSELDIIYNSGAGDIYAGNASLVLGAAQVYAGTNNVLSFNGLNLSVPWTAGTPGSPNVTVAGGGATKLGQTYETTSSGTVTVSIPGGATGNLTVTIGSLSASVPIVALPVGNTIPSISVPANYSLNSSGCLPVTANSLTGAIATSQVKLVVISSQASFALIGLNACDTARTISVSYRLGASGAFTACAFGGNSTIVVQPWEFYTTDIVNSAIAAGSTFYAREESPIPSGSSVISGWHAPALNVGMTVGSTSQLTATGDLTPLVSDAVTAFGPFAIVSPGIRPSVIAGGDSITHFRSATLGYVNQALASVPHVNAGVNGLSHFVQADGSVTLPRDRAILALAQLASHYVDGLGHNTVGIDGSGSQPATYLRDYVRYMVAKLRGIAVASNPTRSFKVWSWTLTPWTSDGGGNTPVSPFSSSYAHSGAGTSYNELVRSSFATYVQTDGVVDMHSVSRRGTGTTLAQQQWLTTPALTTDGTHVLNDVAASNQLAPAWSALTTNLRWMIGGTLAATPGAGQITGTFGASSNGLAPIAAQVRYSANGGTTWTNAAGATSSPFTVAGLSAGTYLVKATYTDSSAELYTCDSNTVSVVVTGAPTAATPNPPAATNTAGTTITLPFSAGTISAPQVLALAGKTITLQTTLPSTGQSLVWNVSPAILSSDSLAGATLNGSALTITNNVPAPPPSGSVAYVFRTAQGAFATGGNASGTGLASSLLVEVKNFASSATGVAVTIYSATVTEIFTGMYVARFLTVADMSRCVAFLRDPSSGVVVAIEGIQLTSATSSGFTVEQDAILRRIAGAIVAYGGQQIQDGNRIIETNDLPPGSANDTVVKTSVRNGLDMTVTVEEE